MAKAKRIWKTNEQRGLVELRARLPKDVGAKLKAKCALEGVSINDKVAELVLAYIVEY